MSENKVEEALDAFISCCESAKQVQQMMDAVLRWKGHLAYLVGQRVYDKANVSCLHFGKKERRLHFLDSRFELFFEGEIHEFQRLACQILAAFPLLPGKNIKDD